MSLFTTNLVIVAAQLPPDFTGDPQEFFEALVERMSIMSPQGTSFFVVGDAEPSSNVGPWLKGGTQWWVFDVNQGRYVPLDISASLHLFVVGPTTPAAPNNGEATLWLRTFETRAIGWYGWDGNTWRPFTGIPASGGTAARPTNPVDLEQFFDTDIKTLIHFERGAWRTVSGTPGDIKFVAQSLLSAALTANPGWQYLGQDDQSIRGLVIGIASTDPGATPVSSFPTDSGITGRSSGEKTGEETHVLTSDEIEQHTHLMGHATALNSNNIGQFHRVDNAAVVTIPPVLPPNYFEINGEGAVNGTKNGTAGDGPAGTMLITSRQLQLTGPIAQPDYTGAAVAHNNMQPSLFLWALVKL
jgi:microcystin-dependent protein